jgi:hypothetical protein
VGKGNLKFAFGLQNGSFTYPVPMNYRVAGLTSILELGKIWKLSLVDFEKFNKLQPAAVRCNCFEEVFKESTQFSRSILRPVEVANFRESLHSFRQHRTVKSV